MKNPEILALIPARGGSKGIPRKNIRLLAGYPLIAYSIAAGLQSKKVTRVVVSTEDEEIAEISRQYGAEVPFMRPAKLAGDKTLDLPVFQHALEWLADEQGYHPKAVVHLRPTTPIRPPDLVDRALGILEAHPEADSVRGITPAHQNPFKMWLMEDEGLPIRPLVEVEAIEESYNVPRQELPCAYAHTGLIDVMWPRTLQKMNSMSGKTILPVLFDPAYSIDLDTPNDWRRAEESMSHSRLPMVWPGAERRPQPTHVDALVLDFDGVLTDNRVWVDQDGREMVAANRSDSLWLEKLRESGVQVFVISKETNPVVAARCRKLNLPYIQSENDKAGALKTLLKGKNIPPKNVVYCGNDLNDLPCFPLAGWAVVVADSVPEVLRAADFVLGKAGGYGAVQELCALILHGNQ